MPLSPVDRTDIGLSTLLDLGGAEKDGPANKTSVFTLKVTDTDGAVGENTFTVRWHLPAKNYVFKGQTSTPDPIALRNAETGASSTDAGLPLTYQLRANQVDWDVPKIASAGSSILGGAGSVAIVFGIASDGVGFAVIGLLAAAGGTYGAIVEPAPDPQIYQVGTGYGVYRATLSQQISSGNYSDGVPRIEATAQNLALLENAPNSPTDDGYWNGTNGSFQVRGRMWRNKISKSWEYEEYGLHGFVGLAPAHTYHWAGYDEQLTYTYTPKTTH